MDRQNRFLQQGLVLYTLIQSPRGDSLEQGEAEVDVEVIPLLRLLKFAVDGLRKIAEEEGQDEGERKRILKSVERLEEMVQVMAKEVMAAMTGANRGCDAMRCDVIRCDAMDRKTELLAMLTEIRI